MVNKSSLFINYIYTLSTIEEIAMSEKSLYDRLGSYDGITGFVNNLLPRMQSDEQLGRFWKTEAWTV